MVYLKNLLERQTHSLTSKAENKSPPPYEFNSDASFLQEAASEASTNPSLLIVWFEQNSSPLHRIYSFLLVRTKESHVTLTNVYPRLHAINFRTYTRQLYPSGTVS
jgi:hypothetical protein